MGKFVVYIRQFIFETNVRRHTNTEASVYRVLCNIYRHRHAAIEETSSLGYGVRVRNLFCETYVGTVAFADATDGVRVNVFCMYWSVLVCMHACAFVSNIE